MEGAGPVFVYLPDNRKWSIRPLPKGAIKLSENGMKGEILAKQSVAIAV